jgi:L-arabinokinase
MVSKTVKAAAPGRLDVMGGIADYSGSLVMQMPIRQQTEVALSLRNDFLCTFHSETLSGEVLIASIDYRSLLNNTKVDYSFSRQKLDHAWFAYVIGCALVLQKTKGIAFTGADFIIRSAVPLGIGVSSSASLEVATMKALSQAFSLSFQNTELPTLAQQVENQIVGAPCGLMDQLASYFGVHGKLLPILCQPDIISTPVDIPSGISFIGIDSGVRHSVGGSSYGDVRCAAFMGYSIILHSLGVAREDIRHSIQTGDFSKLPFQGYLCNISVQAFEEQFKSLLPASMKGKDFLLLYGETIDGVTTVNPETDYTIYECTAHPVYENDRVHRFQNLLKVKPDGDNAESVVSLGALMYQSHESYSRCGLGSERTDEIVNCLKSLTPQGVFGAKITGGGSGGTVCALVLGERGREAVKELHRQLCIQYKAELVLFE